MCIKLMTRKGFTVVRRVKLPKGGLQLVSDADCMKGWHGECQHGPGGDETMVRSCSEIMNLSSRHSLEW